MKIVSIRALAVPEVKVVTYARVGDERGYFTETYRHAQLMEMARIPDGDILQINESYSRGGVVRGFHAQWSPWQGKLVRALSGRLVDLAVDIRLGSPTFGKVVACDLPAAPGAPEASWAWVPPGFAHATWLPEDTAIEYLCTGAWAQGCEVSISPLAADLDWSVCDESLGAEFRRALAGEAVLNDRDRGGLSLAAWAADPRSSHFVYAPGEPGAVADRA